MRFSIALVHHPCVDAAGEVYATSLTNLDVHDVARAGRTYGCDAVYIVHPIEAQRELAAAIAGYWISGAGLKKRNDRTEAMKRLFVTDTIEAAQAAEQDAAEGPVHVWSTSARPDDAALSWREGRARLDDQNVLVIFGTGHGLAPSALALCDGRLAPIWGPEGHAPGAYNHLSVRTAIAVALDRLRGDAAGPAPI